jgi:Nucleotide-diphospho-sugar transferase
MLCSARRTCASWIAQVDKFLAIVIRATTVSGVPSALLRPYFQLIRARRAVLRSRVPTPVSVLCMLWLFVLFCSARWRPEGATLLLSAEAPLSIEFFTAPKPVVGADKVDIERAVRSWLRLTPTPKITLLGWDDGYEAMANKYGLRIDDRIDKTFLGMPLFNSMVHRANQSKASVTVIINADIVLFDDFTASIAKARTSFKDFLVVGARTDVGAFPTDVGEDDPLYDLKVRRRVLSSGTLHTYGGMDFWAWNTNGPRLFDSAMPHFIAGRGKYDLWFTHETIAAGRRQVVDVTEACLSVHVQHPYNLSAMQAVGSGRDRDTGRRDTATFQRPFWSEGKRSKYELFVNIFLSLSVGSYSNHMGTVLFAPWKLARCMESTRFCLMKRVRPGICSCEFSPFAFRTQTDPMVRVGSRSVECGTRSVDELDDFQIPTLTSSSASIPPVFGLPLTLESVTKRLALNGSIIASTVSYQQRNAMFRWICNMRRTGVRNFVVVALDSDLYTYAFTRGLPVFMSPELSEHGPGSSSGPRDVDDTGRILGRVTAQFLGFGVSVLWSDCHVLWTKNVLLDLWTYNAAVVLVVNGRPADAVHAAASASFALFKRSNHLVRALHPAQSGCHSALLMPDMPCVDAIFCSSSQRSLTQAACARDQIAVEFVEPSRRPDLGQGVSVLESSYLVLWLKQKDGTFKLHQPCGPHGLVLVLFTC